ncbi:MAG TPA: substrate-binding domain-containing protein [Solirubrobacteraceae bacterium]|jgi:ribose transport system substrate-binding protein
MSWSKKTGVTAWLLVVASALAIAGCGSSKSSNGGEPSAKTSGSASASSGAVVAQAEKEFSEFEDVYGLEGLTKIGKSIPAGKKIDFVICAPASCTTASRSFAAAAKVLGWSSKTIDAGETPSSQQEVLQQTVAEKPDAVVIEGLATELLTKQIEALKQEKVNVVLWQIAGAKEEPPAQYIIPGPSYYKAMTKAFAAADVVAGGEEADITLATEPAFPIYKITIDPEFKEAVASLCPKCTVNELQLPVSSLGKNATTLITNFVRGHAGTNVVDNMQDVTGLGLDAALKGAGVNNVKIIGWAPTEANFPDLAAETEFAFIANPTQEMAWMVADSLARIYTGEEPTPDIETTAPVVIWTTKNLHEWKGVEPPAPTDYVSKFEELWGK